MDLNDQGSMVDEETKSTSEINADCAHNETLNANTDARCYGKEVDPSHFKNGDLPAYRDQDEGSESQSKIDGISGSSSTREHTLRNTREAYDAPPRNNASVSTNCVLDCTPLLSPFVGTHSSRMQLNSSDVKECLQGAGSMFSSSSPSVPPETPDLMQSPSLMVLQSPFGGALQRLLSTVCESRLNISSSPFPSILQDRSESDEICGMVQADEDHDGFISDEIIVGYSQIKQAYPPATPAPKECISRKETTAVRIDTIITPEDEGQNHAGTQHSSENQAICTSSGNDVTNAYVQSSTPEILTMPTNGPEVPRSPRQSSCSTRTGVSSNNRPSTPVTSDMKGNRQVPATPKSPMKDRDFPATGPPKRTLEDDHLQPPISKRMTLASRERQHQKLASPFRSPLLARPDPTNVYTSGASTAAQVKPRLSQLHQHNGAEGPSTPSREIIKPQPATLPRSRPSTKFNSPLKHGLSSTAKASAQFKSPLLSTTSKTNPRMSSSRQTLELERKLQLLKRASKIKKEEEEEKLDHLAEKWKLVGREAAWELWQIVRDNDEAPGSFRTETTSKSSTGFSSSWGWASSSSNEKPYSNWAWDEATKDEDRKDDSELECPSRLESELYASLSKSVTVPRKSLLPPTPRGAYFQQPPVDSCEQAEEMVPCVDDEETSGQCGSRDSKSLGTMLHQLGIAHETLGWSEEEGDFVDA